MFCKKCGAELKDGAKFCGSCGNPVAAAPQREPEFTQPTPAPQPQYNQPQYNQQPRPVQYVPQYNVVKPQKKTNAVKIVFSVILAVLFFANLIAALTFTALRATVSEEGVVTIFREADIANVEIEDNGVKKTVADLVYEKLPADMHGENGISREGLKKILEDRGFKSDFAQLVGNFVGHMMGNKNKVVTKDDIMNLIRNNEDMIQEKSGYVMTDEDYREIEKLLNSDAYEFFTTDAYDKGTDGLDLNIVLNAVFGVLLFLTILFAGIIALINMRHISHILLYLGIPVFVVGLSLVPSSVPAGSISLLAVVKPMFTLLTIFGIVALVAGAAMIAGFIIIALRKNKKNANAPV